jgi:N-acetylneuraminic acid mutarotase
VRRFGLDRPLVLRVLPRLVSGQFGAIDRLRREARAITRLNHPNILHLEGFGEQDHLLYLASPDVGGLTLDWLLGRPWPLTDALAVLLPLASALDYAHARGVVHRDLQPSNVLIGDDNQVYLTSFGVGWMIEGLAQPNRLLQGDPLYGPPRHIGPEQVAGLPASPASDVYALGSIVFELLTGRPPFRAEIWPAELQPPPPGQLPIPSSVSAALPSTVVQILFRALSEHPERRYASAGELVGALMATLPQPLGSNSVSRSGAGSLWSTSTRRLSGRLKQPARLAAVTRKMLRGRLRHAGGLLGAVAGLMILTHLLVIAPAYELVSGRGSHAAVTLTSGEVLVIGGCGNVPAPGSVAALIRASRTFNSRGLEPGWLDSSILYSPTGRSWSVGARLNQARCDAQAIPLDQSRVLVVGGAAGPDKPLSSAERYDRSTNNWYSAGTLRIPRRDFAVTTLEGGQVLVIGGATTASKGTVLASAERYDPISNNWSLATSLIQARRAPTATLLTAGQILVIGGTTATGSALASAELWDPATNAWSTTGSLQQVRSGHTATLLPDGQVLVVGGSGDGHGQASVERFDPQTGVWRRASALSQPRFDHTATLLPSGQVLVVGGSGTSSSLATAERYDPRTNAWAPAGSIQRPRVHHTATLLPDGLVMISGGHSGDDDGVYLNTAELYDPVTNRWSAAPDLLP